MNYTVQGRHCPILLIDDDPYVLEIMQRVSRTMFPQALYYYCRNTQEAVEYLQYPYAEQPYLILLDVYFGNGVQDGLSFLPSLKKLINDQQLSIIVLSSYGNEARIQQAYDLGATAFLEKPQNYQDWKKCVTTLSTYSNG